jgi:hypothetical protein
MLGAEETIIKGVERDDASGSDLPTKEIKA